MAAPLVRRFRALPRLLFPPRCALCDEPCAGIDLCHGCRGDLPWPGPACRACGERVASGERRCPHCRRRPPSMADTRVALRYEFPADWLVTELKFSARLWHGPLLAVLIAEALEERPIPDLTDAVLVPVPLHRRRQTVRGYNQAVEIARPLSRRIDCRLDTALLVRERATREQSSLSARERRRNVAGAFRLRRSPDFEHGIVVDDVVTTGATSREVARLLRDAGCRRVSVLAAARA